MDLGLFVSNGFRAMLPGDVPREAITTLINTREQEVVCDAGWGT